MRVVKGLHHAVACKTQPLPKPSNTWGRAGLRYERNVVKALSAFIPVWHNPWYHFEDDNGTGYISPDVIVPYLGKLLVVECKLTYKSEAIEKLRRLYCPVVSLATKKPTVPLVITKNLNQGSPEPALVIRAALDLSEPLLHWSGKGSIDWGIPVPVPEREAPDGDVSQLTPSRA